MSPTTRPFPRRTWLAALLAAPVIALFAAAPAHADALDTIAKNGTLRVAVPEDYPPFGSVGTDMQPQGYDIDMAGLLAKALGVKLKLVPVNSANRIPYLTTNKVDMVISSLGKTPEREKVIDFSSAYAPYFQGVFGPSDVKVSAPADLTGKTVGATRGALEEIALSQLAPNATIKRFEDNNATIQAFLSGQVQLIAAGNIVAAAILAKNPPRRPEVKFVIKNSPCFVGVNKNEPRLLAKIDDAIAHAKQDGSLGEMSRKWLGQPLPAGL
ncbi:MULTISPECIES: transporter substrate-binding domain-containing protein [Burkholderia]|uniref:Amino acid ABC transporter substrate-binding protein n=2 Tax=Burkholderia cenocepacia TaxID=95486 RepID=A0A1V2XEX2_9BURK|nr:MULTISPECIES: transporter substrate-binding domain-containing protein [Burkholderia]AIO42948.1 bacterial extracellular solute-binding s, 3 family protein [Burkholderia cepacia]AOK36785.1 amino acid ABC transporter substrate-binding protein [Burkholderia cenocepacia]AQQ23445.1 amino acid ABC transporter substrate-binding protein [Burkholderia cenocepacia]AQQ40281.1 amino acid ABC transporter substrate-binding protein [Burkholderia cenocepacia]ARF90809.1 amino acid ABC transporter periplasmic